MLAEEAMARTAIVVCAGGPARAALPEIPEDALVIAADAGILEAERLGLRVDLLVGDLDSAPVDAIARAPRVERHPVDKDASDLELAMAAAIAAGVRRIVVVGGDGGRLDHLLGNAFLLGSERWAAVEIDAVLGDARIAVVRDERLVDGRVGALISLYAVGGPARGVTTEGLRWALRDGELLPGSSLGLSNEFAAPRAIVRVSEGVVLAIRPGAHGERSGNARNGEAAEATREA
jgi:thiamine pyrophosphokinase